MLCKLGAIWLKARLQTLAIWVYGMVPVVVPLGIFATIYMAIYTFVFNEDNVVRKYAILSKAMQMLGVQRFAIYGCSLLAPRLTLPLAVRHVSHVERWSFDVR